MDILTPSSRFTRRIARPARGVLLALAGVVILSSTAASAEKPLESRPVCIAHRGASAYAPEHTPAAYRLAIEMRADFVEPDLQMTKDGVLVCLHDTSLERTTNVKTVFPDRYTVPQETGTGKTWLVVDFTLAEIKQLDAGSWFGPQFTGERIQTFQEAIDLVKGKAGLYPETKTPGFYESRGLNMVQALARVLADNGLNTPEGQDKTPVIIQSFSPESLQQMKALTGAAYRLIQLVAPAQGEEMLSDEGLMQIAKYAWGIGPDLRLLHADPTRVAAAHRLGLRLHPYTVTARTLPKEYKDLKTYMEFLLGELGVDGFFTDNPDLFPRREPNAP